jgi:hypothetical protein
MSLRESQYIEGELLIYNGLQMTAVRHSLLECSQEPALESNFQTDGVYWYTKRVSERLSIAVTWYYKNGALPWQQFMQCRML